MQVRHSTSDPRLLAEISYAGGATSFEGGAVCYNMPYYKDYPLDESLNCWRYVDCQHHVRLGFGATTSEVEAGLARLSADLETFS